MLYGKWLLAHQRFWLSDELLAWVGSIGVCLSSVNLFSETAGRIKAKFHIKHTWTGETKVCSRG